MNQKVLFIGLVWPEPRATAAGVRITQLVAFFQAFNYEVVFCSAAKKSELSFDFSTMGVKEIQVAMNHESFDDFITDLSPDLVVFDRFLTEEQFGWRVEDRCPTALKILDTEDLHFLRKNREKNNAIEFIHHDLAKREIASIYRCDVSLIISEFEMNFLKNEFNIPDHLIYYLPFLEEPVSIEQMRSYPGFEERNHFISIGNFKHEPNWKAVLRLKTEIWPLIRAALPTAELHIYGAYATLKVYDLHKESEGFIIKGWAENVETVYKNARVCLAPLSFGAGIKGKLLHSMKYGTPNITTSIGAEGMQTATDWNGFIVDDSTVFAQKAIELYTNQVQWEACQKKGVRLFNEKFDKQLFYKAFYDFLNEMSLNLQKYRAENFIGAMLRHHHLRSTKFLSKYIELKNQNND